MKTLTVDQIYEYLVQLINEHDADTQLISLSHQMDLMDTKELDSRINYLSGSASILKKMIDFINERI